MILRATATVLLAVSIIALTGCLGSTPEPTPTPTAVFSSEEEAFAAAEETYRAYIDAVNARRADPQSRPDPQSFLIGEALQEDLDSLREFEELGIRVEGTSVIESVTRETADLATGEIQLQACYDSTAARVVNQAGEDVTVRDRDPRILLDIHFVSAGDQILIEGMSAVDGGSC